MAWQDVRLGDVAEIVGGSTPKTGVAEYWGGDIPWVTPADLSKLESQFIAKTPRTITELGLRSSGARMLPTGSVLLSSRAPIGHVAITTVPMATNQGFKSLVPDMDRIEAKYMYWWLRCHKEYLNGLGVGATFKEISKGIVSEVRIPLPPLPEQHRIASILDGTNALRSYRMQTLKLIDDAFESEFSALMLRSGRQMSLADAGVRFSSGKSLVGTESADPLRPRVAKVSAVSSGEFKASESKPLPAGYVPPASHQIRPGDLLFTRASGSVELIGVAAIVPPIDAEIYLPDKLWRVEISSTTRVTRTFLRLLFRQPAFRAHIANESSGASGVRNISQSKVLAFSALIPDIADQVEFEAKAETSGAIRTQSLSHLAKLDELFASLQYRAFRGEL